MIREPLLPDLGSLRRTPRSTVRLARGLAVGLVAAGGVAALVVTDEVGVRAVVAVVTGLGVAMLAALTSPRAIAGSAARARRVRTVAAVVVLVVTTAVLIGDRGLVPRASVLLLGVIAVTAAYVLPSPRRELLTAGAVAAWVGVLVVAGESDVTVLATHGAGASLLALSAGRMAAVAEHAIEDRADVAERAGERTVLLAAVLRMQSLEVPVIERALLDATRQLGFRAPRLQVAGERPTVRGAGNDATTLRLSLGDAAGVVLLAEVDPATPPARHRALALLLEEAGLALARARRYADETASVEELRRLEAVTQDFVSTVSHELRTPVTVIAGLGATIADRWDDLDADRRTDLLRRIDANADRLTGMVRSLVDSSALERGELVAEPRPLDLREVCAEVAAWLAPLLGDRRVRVDVAPTVRVSADPGLLRHALENLVGNVGNHTPPGTTAVIAAAAVDGRVAISVTDDGPGIAVEDLPHIVDRFYRPAPSRIARPGGLGLGLALVRQIAQAHDGDLVVRPQDGGGVSFAFSVAAAPAGPEPSATSSRAS